MALILTANWFVWLSIALFSVGLYGLMTQTSGIRILMSVELMLNAANINFVAFAGLWGDTNGYVFALFSIAIAAAEAAVGLAILVNAHRVLGDVDVTRADILRW